MTLRLAWPWDMEHVASSRIVIATKTRTGLDFIAAPRRIGRRAIVKGIKERCQLQMKFSAHRMTQLGVGRRSLVGGSLAHKYKDFFLPICLNLNSGILSGVQDDKYLFLALCDCRCHRDRPN